MRGAQPLRPGDPKVPPNLVIEASPGAGKTTRVAPALLDAGLAGTREIVVLEPRRLAARLAARRVADERGERLGGTIGYQVRYEDVSSEKTRLRFVTEGVLTRRLLADPVTIATWVPIHRCPWCGVRLDRFYRTSFPQLCDASISAERGV